MLDCTSLSALQWLFASLLMVALAKWVVNCGHIEQVVKKASQRPRFYENVRLTDKNTIKPWKKYINEEDGSSKPNMVPAASQQASENNLPHQAQLNGIIKAPQVALP